MTITLPWRGTGSRRAVDKLTAVRADNTRLLADNNELRSRHAQTYTAWKTEAQLRAEAEIVAACTQSQLEETQAENERLTTEVTALRAQIANLTGVTVPPMVRDIDPGDHATEPTGIDVRPLWEALREHGPVIPVPTPTAGTSPAHIPTWTAADNTVALHVLRLVPGRS
jgi:hypothetical protein